MTPEETAKFHADRPGFELIDYAEVGLPIIKVYIVASLLLHTPLPPIFEFVLRCVRLNINTCDSVAACLGIPKRMVSEAIQSLHRAEEIDFIPNQAAGYEAFVLTRRGQRTVASLVQIVPEQETLPIYFDGLTRKPIAPPEAQLLAGKQAAELGLKEIPALPPTRVEVSDIDTDLAARLFAKERIGETRRDLLSIKAIDRRMRLHLPATALVYRSSAGDEVELLFAIESKMLDEHNRAFALAEGPRKTRLLAELGKTELIGTDSFSRRLASIDRSLDPSTKTAKRPSLSLPGRRAPIPPKETLKRLSVLDHPPLLRDAFVTAVERVLIICPWITSQVVDAKMLALIESMLERGVAFYLGFGLDDEVGKKQKAIPPQLEALTRRYPKFRLVRLGNTHEKVLIKDREFAVLTSFNWLSFRGDASRPLRLERGVCIQHAETVDEEFNTLASRFMAEPAGNSKKRAKQSEKL
ncbi:hypothetical protein GFL68_28205 [Rhizobium laguerreae]|uniref:hypothetical protein n=1 Tax=Rhizobium laguerreae TaxID=1076926 RepID=UPI001441C1B6|nr:hypothetical protein [Rhizobium laguerreae]NKM42076.1 hypothetical protein [Rhizobium laguerreae]